MEGLFAAVCKKRKRPSGCEGAPSNARREHPAKTGIEASPVLRLNVGGKEYVTSLSTLRRVDSGMLAKMFGSNLPSATIGGAYFIDRDGDLFRFVLSYLRDGAVELPSSFQELRRLEREASFFLLPGMLQLIRSKMSEVHLEVRLFAEPFGCTAEQCNCGDIPTRSAMSSWNKWILPTMTILITLCHKRDRNSSLHLQSSMFACMLSCLENPVTGTCV
ncbi:Kctd8 [Symbiodinium necroappetens]|uniref:Kctd8 protein n=1 Tax=Symbiodinium necroappetens TaxID=1628268 RepID=A0A812RKW8_9DINO|nr:Kctd8 [Symbiodinium necroappetens]